jgi:uncharacterized protein
MKRVVLCVTLISVTALIYSQKVSDVRAEEALASIALAGSFDDLKKMLELYPHLNTEYKSYSHHDNTPVMNAAQREKDTWVLRWMNTPFKMVKALVEYGFPADTENIHGETALLAASRMGHYDVVQYLLEKNANVTHRDNAGATALAHAARAGHTDIVKLLLSHPRASEFLNRANERGRTPLMLAAEYGHRDIVKLLGEKGAELNARDRDGKTALILAAQSLNHALQPKNANILDRNLEAIVRYLIQKGADKTVRDTSGKSALDYIKAVFITDPANFNESLANFVETY